MGMGLVGNTKFGGSHATSNPDIQAMSSWAWGLRLRHLATSNPDIQNRIAGRRPRYLSLCT